MAVGPIDQYNVAGYLQNPRSAASINEFSAKHDRLIGILQLAQSGKLKGQGPITENERKMLANAATTLKRGVGEAYYKKTLGEVRDYFTRKQSGQVRPLETSGPVNIGRFEIVK